MRVHDEPGITLIELLVAITILGIISGIVVISLGDTSVEAARNSCSAQIDAVQSAIRRYVDDGNGRLREFDSVEDVNDRLIPSYLADELVQVDGFTISIADGVVTGTYGANDDPCP